MYLAYRFLNKKRRIHLLSIEAPCLGFPVSAFPVDCEELPDQVHHIVQKRGYQYSLFNTLCFFCCNLPIPPTTSTPPTEIPSVPTPISHNRRIVSIPRYGLLSLSLSLSVTLLPPSKALSLDVAASTLTGARLLHRAEHRRIHLAEVSALRQKLRHHCLHFRWYAFHSGHRWHVHHCAAAWALHPGLSTGAAAGARRDRWHARDSHAELLGHQGHLFHHLLGIEFFS
jgi:hypothetical protein